MRGITSKVCFSIVRKKLQIHSFLQGFDSKKSEFTAADVKKFSDAKSLAKRVDDQSLRKFSENINRNIMGNT